MEEEGVKGNSTWGSVGGGAGNEETDQIAEESWVGDREDEVMVQILGTCPRMMATEARIC